jgi:acyl-coenzyme A thioesterase PaaI-like protein
MSAPQNVTLEALQQYADRCNEHPSFIGFGVKVHFPDVTRLRIRVDSIPPLMRGGLGDAGIVNGGVLSALCDVLIGCSCGLVEPASRSGTVQLSIRFERPLRGALIEGEARVDRATKRLVFASGELSDAQGEVCVRVQGIATLLAGAVSSGGAPTPPAF